MKTPNYVKKMRQSADYNFLLFKSEKGGIVKRGTQYTHTR